MTNEVLFVSYLMMENSAWISRDSSF